MQKLSQVSHTLTMTVDSWILALNERSAWHNFQYSPLELASQIALSIHNNHNNEQEVWENAKIGLWH